MELCSLTNTLLMLSLRLDAELQMNAICILVTMQQLARQLWSAVHSKQVRVTIGTGGCPLMGMLMHHGALNNSTPSHTSSCQLPLVAISRMWQAQCMCVGGCAHDPPTARGGDLTNQNANPLTFPLCFQYFLLQSTSVWLCLCPRHSPHSPCCIVRSRAPETVLVAVHVPALEHLKSSMQAPALHQ